MSTKISQNIHPFMQWQQILYFLFICLAGDTYPLSGMIVGLSLDMIVKLKGKEYSDNDVEGNIEA